MRGRDKSAELQTEVAMIGEVRQRIRTEVYTRYTTLKGQSRQEDEARNVACAWTAQRFPRWSPSVIRRELEAALAPPSAKASALGRRRPGILSGPNWRLPE